MEMILFIGIQASGKSEFYKRSFYNSHLRINLDMLKTRNRENILLEACFRAKQAFVVDNTNPTKAERQKYINIAKEAGFIVKGYYFRSGIQECLARNEKRTGKEHISTAGVLATHKKLELPSFDEGFDALYYVQIGAKGQFITEEYQDEI